MRTTKNITPPSKVGSDNKQHERDLSQQRGFTIIEVALVLAIAGLIFLVVFLALPALQNSQKDTARRQDVGRVVAALQAYEADNGELPSGGYYYAGSDAYTAGQLFSRYVGQLDQDKGVQVWDSTDANAANTANWAKTASAMTNRVGITLGYTCSGLGISDSGGNTSSSVNAAVWVWLLSGTAYCTSM